MVKQLQNGNPFTVVIMENKRASLVGQTSVWRQAVDELAEYLDIEFNNAKPKPKFQVGLVAIGRYVRFYRREPNVDLQDYPGTNGKAFEINNDKEEVQDTLAKIKVETQKK